MPCLNNPDASVSWWSVLKELIGKDINRISMPVQINEPLDLLQRPIEDLYMLDILEKYKEEDTSLRRLIWIATYNAARFYHFKGRFIKPFNPMLGETYELVTPTYRMIAEQVSHHPPIASPCV